MTAVNVDIKKAEELERQFDAEMHFRPLLPPATWIVAAMLFALSCFHYYTAGFGLLREQTHRGIHMALVLGLIFLVFAANRRHADAAPVSAWWKPGAVPLYDWALLIAAAVASLYLPAIFEDIAFRVGNPLPIDVVMGTILTGIVLEATRRTMGWPLVIISLAFIAYAFLGPWMPGILVHPGTTWSQLMDHLYLTSQGIYGIPIGVVATYVFHFVLFGVVAMRIGLGRLFLALAMAVAGRFAGGPAKVAIFGSALFGMISGSSVANAVTVGSLTIPMMKRLGYRPHFAAGVEATASTGGQITPPVMGAAAFLMVEYLSLPYQTIIVAAIVPAFLHFFGVFVQVHFEAKRVGLRGLEPHEMPDWKATLRADWVTLIPLAGLLWKLFDGSTPYLAAFWGISLCIAVGIIRPLIAAAREGSGAIVAAGRMAVTDMVDAFVMGAKYALAVGAAAAAIGIIIGVVTLTGTALKFATIIVGVANDAAGVLQPFLPTDRASLVLIFTLIMTALVCILMGCGVPTTATYIIMVTVAAPAMGLLGVAPLVTHFFVFYYGVLADVTPPVAVAAYAAASMAAADPFRTGNTAFRLALAKALVPFVFVFSPSLLLVLPGFSWGDFLFTLGGCLIGITFLGAAFSRYLLTPLAGWECWLLGIASLPTIAPGITSTLIGIAMAVPVLARQLLAWRAQRAVAPLSSRA
ncbi:TRAP transporter permease [Reyranella sp. CPCC 100927]|uniref:TRAP transporter permease n=1 Tax=Reyranella sp. CPCC 100927 TaxID=2599616 RepID=UPI0011B3D31E|nr:TRAP transporter permease [Reyranella sp. CPCC 100927]TWS94464.1 TRAP transporter permease [Reyranella sp. CPCC 100927]